MILGSVILGSVALMFAGILIVGAALLVLIGDLVDSWFRGDFYGVAVYFFLFCIFMLMGAILAAMLLADLGRLGVLT